MDGSYGLMTTGFMPVLIVCIAGGIVFAVIAFLTAQRASAALAAGGDPTKIALGSGITVSTGNAVVALFILAVITATGVPACLLYLNNGRDDGPVTLELTRLQPAISNLQITSRDYGSGEVARFGIYRSSETQHFKITPTPQYSALDVDAYYSWPDKLFFVTVDSDKVYRVAVDGVSARLDDPIVLKRAAITGMSSASSVKLSEAAGLSRAALALPDPSGVTQQ